MRRRLSSILLLFLLLNNLAWTMDQHAWTINPAPDFSQEIPSAMTADDSSSHTHTDEATDTSCDHHCHSAAHLLALSSLPLQLQYHPPSDIQSYPVDHYPDLNQRPLLPPPNL